MTATHLPQTAKHQHDQEEFSDSEPNTGRRTHRGLIFHKVEESGSHGRRSTPKHRRVPTNRDPPATQT
ncbi:hypothetical protein HMPREF1129_0408 [Actinomyces naeslundii str. Howell 279]|uniref:Uncharacterized protein n=1 Tax=Actinomyces naeslundii (strain ATCC 12104 / DSM 43013 / CCUG 2238 / JCM 8349 / NCTC 10301 / Howell 279) TaxID=1115803 RepID=J3F236_ACTNH|nr:hypothetical protein HMPREF1129_0408 [Actinomyces naeslundii str. Howell 279]